MTKSITFVSETMIGTFDASKGLYKPISSLRITSSASPVSEMTMSKEGTLHVSIRRQQDKRDTEGTQM